MNVAPRLLAAILVVGCGTRAAPPSPQPERGNGPEAVAEEEAAEADDPIAETPSPAPPEGLACLRDAYPESIEELALREEGWVAILADGREAVWDDGHDKDADERLEAPDLQDTLADAYPRGEEPAPPGEAVEPGRVRHAALFEVTYGEDEGAVRAHLEEVRWPGGGRARISSQNGAADALREVIAELRDIPREARRCLEPPIGSFFHRTIRGTDRLSPHAFGIAIDLNSSCGEYWRWQRPFEGRWRNRMPRALVDAFEAHGFIWGGRWYHYDTFHFEYRPELFRCGSPRSL